MAKSIGILVTSPQNMRHVRGITEAAIKKGGEVKIFFTWLAVHLTQCPEFQNLCALDKVEVSICADSYKRCGYDPNQPPAGLTAKGMGTQAQHTAIIENYDCYLTL